MHKCQWISRDFDKPEDPLEGFWGKYGGAIEQCTEHDDGSLWVDNGEYASCVNYCPFCGTKATKQIPNELFTKETP